MRFPSSTYKENTRPFFSPQHDIFSSETTYLGGRGFSSILRVLIGLWKVVVPKQTWRCSNMKKALVEDYLSSYNTSGTQGSGGRQIPASVGGKRLFFVPGVSPYLFEPGLILYKREPYNKCPFLISACLQVSLSESVAWRRTLPSVDALKKWPERKRIWFHDASSRTAPNSMACSDSIEPSYWWWWWWWSKWFSLALLQNLV